MSEKESKPKINKNGHVQIGSFFVPPYLREFLKARKEKMGVFENTIIIEALELLKKVEGRKEVS